MQSWLPLSEIKDPLLKDCYNYNGESATIIIIVNCMCAGVTTVKASRAQEMENTKKYITNQNVILCLGLWPDILYSVIIS